MTEETFKNLLPKFISHLEEKRRSPSTVLAYRADLEQLVDFLRKIHGFIDGLKANSAN